ncbi:hypothetical protein Cgig2_003449 [Carnegiea gigantea]|uniref:Uncharacterized protein n=1 Tax=Carnegiea gigantea TaxID=171969 RepID=A0A9Q1KBY6_9CARY|nr:hypothetical protein Cgig2_003449 [Carnegiea gigantea]
MSEIPPPVCFGITSAPVEPTTPPPSHIEMSHVSTASPSVPAATVVSPPFTPPLLSSTQAVPRYPFYFNNLPSPHNAHPSLPLNVPPFSAQPNPFAFPFSRFSNSIYEPGSSSQRPTPTTDLVHYALIGHGREYQTLVTTLTHIPLQLSFDDLRPCLLLHEQRLRTLDDNTNSISHPALVTHQGSPSAAATFPQ